MATIKKFEDLEIWKLARDLAKIIFSFIKYEAFSKDYKLINQINSSTGSVMDNIAEGFDRGGRKEFINFLSIARGSCGETKSQLYRAFDRKYISEHEFKSTYDLANEVSNKTQSLIVYLNSTNIKGQKFKSRVEESYSTYGIFEFDLMDETEEHQTVNSKQ